MRAAQIDVERFVILQPHAHQRAGHGSFVQPLGTRDRHLRVDVQRHRFDVVVAIEESEAAVGDEELSDVEAHDLARALRTRLPLREVVAAVGKDLEPQSRLANVDAIEFHRAAPERFDAAGDLDLFDRCEVLRHAAGCIGDAQVVDDHALRARLDDRDLADGHVAAEARFERVLDALSHQVGEARRAEIPPAAADDDEQDDQSDREDPDQTFEATKHRALALALARGAVPPLTVLQQGRRKKRISGVGNVHPVGRQCLLITSLVWALASSNQEKVPQVVARRRNHNRLTDLRGQGVAVRRGQSVTNLRRSGLRPGRREVTAGGAAVAVHAVRTGEQRIAGADGRESQRQLAAAAALSRAMHCDRRLASGDEDLSSLQRISG